MKPAGILRVVVPDLESIARHYLKWLELALTGNEQAELNYDWIMLEMYDQCVRESEGGQMGRYLTQASIPNESFVRGRMGNFLDVIRESRNPTSSEFESKPGASNGSSRGAKSRLADLLKRLSSKSVAGGQKMVDEEWRRIGAFRRSGEIHHWMYDQFSLARLLRKCGFREPQLCTAFGSDIPDWNSFYLDAEPDGTVYKPDSLFMEATK
jgi:hypothetical protein